MTERGVVEQMSDRELLESIDEDCEGLSDWELKFLEDQMRSVYPLSPPQRSKAKQIYEERFAS